MEQREQQARASEAEQLKDAVTRRGALEKLAQLIPRTPLPEDVRRSASLLIAHHGTVESDGGLWLTLGKSTNLPAKYLDPWLGEVYDCSTVLAHLQVRGLVRQDGPIGYSPWQGYWEIAVDRYLVTCTIDEAVSLRLVSGAILRAWAEMRAATSGYGTLEGART